MEVFSGSGGRCLKKHWGTFCSRAADHLQRYDWDVTMPAFLCCCLNFDIKDNKELCAVWDWTGPLMDSERSAGSHIYRLTDYTSASDMKGTMHHPVTGALFSSATAHASFSPTLVFFVQKKLVLYFYIYLYS